MGIKLLRLRSCRKEQSSRQSERSSLRKPTQRSHHSCTAESDLSQLHPPQNLVVEENDDVSSIHCDESVSSPTFCFAQAPPRSGSTAAAAATVPGPIKFVRSDSRVDGRPMNSPAPSSRATPPIDNTSQPLPALTSLLYLSLVTFELHKNQDAKTVVKETLQRHAFFTVQNDHQRRTTSVPVDVDDVSFVEESDTVIQDLVLGHLDKRNLVAAIDVVQARVKSKKAAKGTLVPLYFQLSALYMLYGDVKKAQWSSQRAICSHAGGHSQQLVAALHNVGMVLLYARKPTQALAQFRQAIHLECKLVGYDHACIPLLLNNLAICHVFLKNYNVAMVLLQESLYLLRDFQHSDLSSLHYMATTLMNLGIVSSKRKDYAQAVSYFEEGLMVMDSIVDQDDSFLQQCRNTFHQLLVEEQSAHEECIPIQMPIFGYADGISLRLGKHPVDVIVMGSLLHEQTLESRVQKAVMSSFRTSMLGSAQTKASIPIDVDRDTIVDAELHLAAIHARVWKHINTEELEEGLELMRLTLRSHKRKYGPVHPLVGSALHNMALVYLYAGQYQDADYYFQEAASVRIAALGPNHPDVSTSMMKLGMVQLAHGNLDTAKVTFTQVLKSRREMIGYHQPEVARIINLIGYIQYELSKPLKAITSMRDALEILRKCGGCDADAAETLSSMGFVFAKNQEYAEAAAVLKEAVSLQRRVLSDAHPHTIVTRENLNHVLSLVQPGTVAYKPIHPCVESPIDLNCRPLSSFTPQWNDD